MDNDINKKYDEILDAWAEKVLNKADEYLNKSKEYDVVSREYIGYKEYAEGLYMALAMLSNEERKYNRKQKRNLKENEL